MNKEIRSIIIPEDFAECTYIYYLYTLLYTLCLECLSGRKNEEQKKIYIKL